MIVVGQGVVDWMASQGHEFKAREAQGIGWAEKGELIAGVAYTDFNGANLCMHVVAVPGRRWLRREYLWTCFDYPFNQCKVQRVTGLVGEGNLEARRFDEHLGFVLETTLQGAHPSGDLLVYVLWKDRCKWISQDFCKPLAKAA